MTPRLSQTEAATHIHFRLAANYTASASENVTGAEALILDDFDASYRLAVLSGELWDALVAAGRRLRRRRLSSLFDGVTIEEDSTLASIEAATVSTELVSEETASDELLQCPAGTYSLSGEACKPCEKGTYTSLPGQPSCQLCPPFSTTSSEGATGCYSCRARVFALNPRLRSHPIGACRTTTSRPLPWRARSSAVRTRRTSS